MKLVNIFTVSFAVFFSLLMVQSCSTNEETPLEPFNTIAKGGAVVSANNLFAFSLFEEIAQSETEANFMISPVSASLALGMVYNGAAGDTQQAFSNVFNYGDITLEQTNLVNQNIINHLTRNASGTTFEIANSLWVNNSFPVNENFLEANRSYYTAEVQNKDFRDPNTLKTINNWVSNKTNGKISNILDGIAPNAVLYAINALYFKSDWKYRFDVKDTKKRSFQLNNGTVKQVDMMSMSEDLNYFSNSIFSSVELPYANNEYTMILMLPNVENTVDDILAIMNNENWMSWQSSYSEHNLRITMPKFTFSYKKEFNEALVNLGLGIAFSDNANFSGISDISTKISFVLQKTFIDVNEEGTEAAAVTVVGVETTSVNSPKHFLLDRPFIFAIKEKETGSICFIGKVGNPEYQ
ncbi:serpin family protein [Mariniflexile sp.]|uniref:serpin family protein n=1 Tax=Mariniflexile sp. TaxID=1979402 RepID=UPI003563A968